MKIHGCPGLRSPNSTPNRSKIRLRGCPELPCPSSMVNTLSVRDNQPRHRKHKQSQPLTDTKDNTNDYNLRPRPPPPTRRPLAQCRDKVLIPSPLEKLRDQPDRPQNAWKRLTYHNPQPNTDPSPATPNTTSRPVTALTRSTAGCRKTYSHHNKPERPQNAEHHAQHRREPDRAQKAEKTDTYRNLRSVTGTHLPDRPTDRPTAE